jgi:predicted ester cyclase
MPTLEEKNKAVVLRLKDEISSKGRFEVSGEIMAPGFRPRRQGMHNLIQNAREQGFPEPGSQMRAAFPDRVDNIEFIMAEGDRVGMAWRQTGTHLGNLCGIPPTGKKIDVAAAGYFRVENGLINEATFMLDEAGMLLQLGAPLPKRKDGQYFVPPSTGDGKTPREVLEGLYAKPPTSQQDQNKIVALRTEFLSGPEALAIQRAPNFVQTRAGLPHLRDYGKARNAGHLNPGVAFPDRDYKIEGVIAEGERVWVQFRLTGTHSGSLYGFAPTGRRIEMLEVGVMKMSQGKVAEAWYLGDELGLLLQTDALSTLAPAPQEH